MLTPISLPAFAAAVLIQKNCIDGASRMFPVEAKKGKKGRKSAAGAGEDKGKEKELPAFSTASPAADSPGGGDEGEGDDHPGKVGKKWKNNYKHLIKNIPGAFCVRLFSGHSG